MIEVFELIYAWAVGALGRDRAHEIVWPFLDRLTQTSPETAAWGALADVGLEQHAQHLKDLVGTVESVGDGDYLYLNLRRSKVLPDQRPRERARGARRS